jgi:hypothetical protein
MGDVDGLQQTSVYHQIVAASKLLRAATLRVTSSILEFGIDLTGLSIALFPLPTCLLTVTAGYPGFSDGHPRIVTLFIR